MKLLIWKIIALVSVFMGGLGPNIAVGNQQEPVPAPEVTQSAGLIPVVTAASETKVVVQDPGINCASASFQLGRFDLLLWSDCEATLSLGTVETEHELAVAVPKSWPELSVTEGPYQSITSTYDAWANQERNSGGFAYQLALETKTKSSLSIRQSALALIAAPAAGSISDDSMKTVVLRC